jgi:hypothetical protein
VFELKTQALMIRVFPRWFPVVKIFSLINLFMLSSATGIMRASGQMIIDQQVIIPRILCTVLRWFEKIGFTLICASK